MGIFGKTPEAETGRAAARPSPPAKAPAAASSHERRDDPPSNCLIGAKTVIKGELSGQEDVVVRGRVDGTVSVERNLIVDSGGRVQASVRAAAVIISGEVVGDCHARERVELRSTGRLKGDIHAPRIVIAEGAAFHGRSHMGGSAAAGQAGVTQKAG